MAARGADRERQEAVVDTPPAEEFVAGRRPVLEALRAGTPINKIVIAQGAEGGSLAEIVGKAKAAGVLLQNAPKAHLTSVAGENHQGVLAYVAPRAYADLEDVIARKTGQAPLIILLDGVTDPHNLGAVVRTAEAAGAQGVVIPKRRSVPLTGTVAKAAAGALEYVPVARVSNLNQAMDRLKKAGYWIVGLAAEGDTPYTEVDYRGSIALVVGSEGQGLSRLVEERCDYLVRLPMHGEVQSLNASVAAGVMLYEIVRQRG
ncbi:23S rRNA (guanosine(2251)-2'-O)-methyltransferase RlmB [Alicyclobacillus cycloheptanicus]|nr:23S rRNA (guanosine(2251)-2'-O)-methyltransferase RlmB [Alicyclobacillus cycloheptanicus]WDM02918.1 23S rRNA (guanosine(2251)-2'-O)-methyltransferase RlmB [Alicyclobacillus cycloheptanicus]